MDVWQLYNSLFLWYTFYGTILSGFRPDRKSSRLRKTRSRISFFT